MCDRLEPLYRLSSEQSFKRPDGSVVPKMVYLDMEKYRDMHLTAEAFIRTLDRPGLEAVRADIVLQAYLPDAATMQRRLSDWARARVAAGGAPVMLRLVKGANMEMEKFEAAVGGWPHAPFATKTETDANFKRMLTEGMRPENLAAAQLGVGSHNLFDIAYALVLASETNAGEAVHFEMLEGMANHQRRALEEHASDILLYAPACRRENFIYAIGYLIRRLDENTGDENFLRHAFRVHAGDPEWTKMEQEFLKSIELMPGLSDAPRRTQDRQALAGAPKLPDDWRKFIIETDTDFALPQNSEFAETVSEPNVNQFARLRFAAPDRVPEALRRAAHEACIYIADTPVLSEGRLELLWYVEEQSLSHDYHRYGNLGACAGEKRNWPG